MDKIETSSLDDIIEYVARFRETDAQRLVQQAYDLAARAHEGQYRTSGEPYVTHCVAVAGILKSLNMDPATIAAGLVHDTVEDSSVTLAQIEQEINPEVASLVDGMTKLDLVEDMTGRPYEDEAESFRKMFLAMADDLRVVLIKLADRLHNMRTVGILAPDRRQRLAKETLEVWAPLANRLGIWQIKWELEDLSFKYLEPEIYRQIAKMIDERRINRDRYNLRIVENLKDELNRNGIEAEVAGRSKHIYSIWRKMKRKGVGFDQIYDVQGVRVLVEKVEDCYAALGIVHTLWRPIPGEFDDYIATPKDNLYRSLHTALIGSEGKTLEVQIRTFQMDQDAELGVAAHWRYKEGSKPDVNFDKKVAWLRQVIEWRKETDAREFLDSLKSDAFQERVYAFTPKGDIIDLPQGATPIDFAYYIHTEVGHRCRGAKVNGKIVPLNYHLKNGEKVEILVTKRGGPSRDWLNVHLGYLRTSRARSKVRHWFRYQNYEQNVSSGRAILDKELHRLGITEINYEKLAQFFNFNKVDDFLAAIGRSDINTTQMVSAINELVEVAQPAKKDERELPVQPPPRAPTDLTGMKIQGVGNLLTHLAQCCRPVPGDDAIIGYITRGRGVTIHRRDCPNVLRLIERDGERLIAVDWDPQGDATYPIDVQIEAFDRPRLLHDITAIVANEKINMSAVHVITKKKENKALVSATLEIANIDQLSRVLVLIAQLPNVVEVRRRRN